MLKNISSGWIFYRDIFFSIYWVTVKTIDFVFFFCCMLSAVEFYILRNILLFIIKIKKCKKKGRHGVKEWEAQEYHSESLSLPNQYFLVYILNGLRIKNFKRHFLLSRQFFCLYLKHNMITIGKYSIVYFYHRS